MYYTHYNYCYEICESKRMFHAIAEFLCLIANNSKAMRYIALIVQHSLYISCPAHLWYGHGNHEYRTQLKTGHYMLFYLKNK